MDCHQCGKRGHIASVCRSKKSASGKRPQSQQRRAETPHPRRRGAAAGQRLSTNQVTAERDQESGGSRDPDYLPLYKIGRADSCPIRVPVPVVLNGVTHSMELDTGAAITVISEAKCQELFPGAMLRKSDLLLKTYTEPTILHWRRGWRQLPAPLAVCKNTVRTMSHFRLTWNGYSSNGLKIEKISMGYPWD